MYLYFFVPFQYGNTFFCLCKASVFCSRAGVIIRVSPYILEFRASTRLTFISHIYLRTAGDCDEYHHHAQRETCEREPLWQSCHSCGPGNTERPSWPSVSVTMPPPTQPQLAVREDELRLDLQLLQTIGLFYFFNISNLYS